MTLEQKKRSQRAFGPYGGKKHGKANDYSIPKLIATDDGSWNIAPQNKVERISVKQSLTFV